MSLTEQDLAYMRETQAEHRPTAALLFRRVGNARTATGGFAVSVDAGGDPVQVRIDTAPDRVPLEVGTRLEGADAARITMDQARDVRAGDRLQVSPSEAYEVVTEGDQDAWQTAQQVWARRVVWPIR